MTEPNNKKGSVRRVLLAESTASDLNKLIRRLRAESCKVDASKAVNQIVYLFLNKYLEKDYKDLKGYFFDKKSHLRELIKRTENGDLDDLLQKYLDGSSSPKKKRGRKSKNKDMVDTVPAIVSETLNGEDITIDRSKNGIQ